MNSIWKKASIHHTLFEHIGEEHLDQRKESFVHTRKRIGAYEHTRKARTTKDKRAS